MNSLINTADFRSFKLFFKRGAGGMILLHSFQQTHQLGGVKDSVSLSPIPSRLGHVY